MSILLKLLSGETLISTVEKGKDNLPVVLNNPMSIIHNTQGQLMLIPFPIGSSKIKKCVMKEEYIMSMSMSSQELGIFYANQIIDDLSNTSTNSMMIH